GFDHSIEILPIWGAACCAPTKMVSAVASPGSGSGGAGAGPQWAAISHHHGPARWPLCNFVVDASGHRHGDVLGDGRSASRRKGSRRFVRSGGRRASEWASAGENVLGVAGKATRTSGV